MKGGQHELLQYHCVISFLTKAGDLFASVELNTLDPLAESIYPAFRHIFHAAESTIDVIFTLSCR